MKGIGTYLLAHIYVAFVGTVDVSQSLKPSRRSCSPWWTMDLYRVTKSDPPIIQARLSKAKELRDSQRKQLTEIKESLKVEQSARPESVKTKFNKESRSNALAQLADLRKQVVALEKELAAYGDCDPVKIEEKKRAVFLAKEATLRWTDNYGTLLSYFVRQNGVDPADIRRYLEIDENYENI
ncbi:hypothetical protein H0H93_003519 [Arthromyces matolae]|nr:hypothetical protein H0H93_003519 [Arthromyces matolae]